MLPEYCQYFQCKFYNQVTVEKQILRKELGGLSIVITLEQFLDQVEQCKGIEYCFDNEYEFFNSFISAMGLLIKLYLNRIIEIIDFQLYMSLLFNILHEKLK